MLQCEFLYFCSSHAVTSDVSLSETAQAAELFLSDGVIVTGTATGVATDVNDLHGTISRFCPQ